MNVEVDNRFDFFCELRREPELSGIPLSSVCCTPDLRHLVDEAVTKAVLAERLAADVDTVRVCVQPIFKNEPMVERIEIELAADQNGSPCEFVQEFRSGPWVRAAHQRILQLREGGSLAESRIAYRSVVALPNAAATVPVGDLQPPVIEEGTLEACGVRFCRAESLTAHRPVLVNERFLDDALRMCEEAGVLETGGAALGRMIRLDEPLPGSSSRVVTILSSIVGDSRHIGTESRFQLSPTALAEAQQMADLRGLKEQVLTVFHTHGWNRQCANCHTSENCPLFDTTPSVHDYEQLLDRLFTSKTTLLPIAGRKLGATGHRPVLEVHAWRGGEMRPLRWGTYQD